MVRLKDIAKLTGFSINTVSRALNNKIEVKKETRRKILRVAKELNYQPNALARSMVLKKTNLVGLVISEIKDPFYSQLTSVIENYVHSNNYKLILYNTNEDPEREVEIINLLMQQKADGIIIIPTQKNKNIIKKLVENNFPLVIISRKFNSFNANSVISNFEQGVFNIVNYFHKYGKRRIGMLNGIERTSSAKSRLTGYKKSLDFNNISYDEKLVKHYFRNPIDITQSIEELLSLEPKIDSVFAYDYLTTSILFKIIRKKKINVPDDLVIIGFEEENLAQNNYVPITTLSQDIEKIGKQAIEILIKKIKQPNLRTINKVIDTKIISRKSCGE